MNRFLKENKIAILISFLFFYFFYYPITSIHLLYRDDYVRSFWNELGWTQEGRILSKLTINILTFSNGIDIAPFTHFLSIFFIAFTVVHSAKIIFNKINLYSISLASLVFLNPFYLQNMSFGYDNLPMTLSVCSAIYAALFIFQVKKYNYFICIPLIYILFSYQAALGVYVNYLIFLLFKHYLENGFYNQNKIYTKIAFGFFIFLMLSVIYKLLFPFLFTTDSSRIYFHLSFFKDNIIHLNRSLKLLFYPFYPIILWGVSLLLLMSLIKISYKNKNLPCQFPLNFLINSFFLIGSLFIIFCASKGPSILLPYDSHAERVLMGISCLWLLVLYNISKLSKTIYYSLYFSFALLCFSFNYTYGFFLQEQNRYFNMILTNIHYDISHDKNAQHSHEIIALNPFPIIPSNKIVIQRNPLIGDIYAEHQLYWLATLKLYRSLPKASLKSYKDICALNREVRKQKIVPFIRTEDYSLSFYKNIYFIDFYNNEPLVDGC